MVESPGPRRWSQHRRAAPSPAPAPPRLVLRMSPPQDMSTGPPLPDLCHRYPHPLPLPPSGASPLLSCPHPPDAAAELDRWVATTSPPPTTLAPDAITVAYTAAATLLPGLPTTTADLTAGPHPQHSANSTGVSHRAYYRRCRSPAPSFAYYRCRRRLPTGPSTLSPTRIVSAAIPPQPRSLVTATASEP